MTKVKICGLRDIRDVEIVNETMPDYVGFVFAKSRRRVSASLAEEMKNNLSHGIQSVGVFVNAPLEDIVCLGRRRVIDIVQLHGDEDLEYILSLKAKSGLTVIKAVRMKDAAAALRADKLPCDYLLLDSFSPGMQGGSGKCFDHSIIPFLEKPFFLAGGINEKNHKDALVCNPYCLDISSGVETDGRKDAKKIKDIIGMIREEC